MFRRLLVHTLVWTLFILTLFESAKIAPPLMNIDDEMYPDEETGRRVAQWTKEMKVNPEELGSYLEGDIMVTKDTKRNGLTDESKRWPNGIIPYIITGNFNEEQSALISSVMDEYKEKTCITFVKRTNESNYIEITSNDDGCWSNLGMNGGNQTVNLQIPGCVTLRGTVIHELMHVSGCTHEHTRDDRDNFVEINWRNIQLEVKGNFVKDPVGITKNFNVSYDYDSVMHYSSNAFAENPKEPTIIPTNPRNAKIGQREDFSRKDIIKINRMYNC